jgi:hypothetical protein
MPSLHKACWNIAGGAKAQTTDQAGKAKIQHLENWVARSARPHDIQWNRTTHGGGAQHSGAVRTTQKLYLTLAGYWILPVTSGCPRNAIGKWNHDPQRHEHATSGITQRRNSFPVFAHRLPCHPAKPAPNQRGATIFSEIELLSADVPSMFVPCAPLSNHT